MQNSDLTPAAFVPHTWIRAFRLAREVEQRREFWCRAPRIVSAEVRAQQRSTMLSMLFAEQSAAMHMALLLPW